MGILEKLGLKKKPAAALEKKAPADPEEEATAPGLRPKEQSPRAGNAYQILLRPILSEKGTSEAPAGRYIFAVHSRANKSEIRKSIERVYGVHVIGVRIVKLPGKLRRYGKTIGRTPSRKKAMVTLREGEKIPGIIESVG